MATLAAEIDRDPLMAIKRTKSNSLGKSLPRKSNLILRIERTFHREVLAVKSHGGSREGDKLTSGKAQGT